MSTCTNRCRKRSRSRKKPLRGHPKTPALSGFGSGNPGCVTVSLNLCAKSKNAAGSSVLVADILFSYLLIPVPAFINKQFLHWSNIICRGGHTGFFFSFWIARLAFQTLPIALYKDPRHAIALLADSTNSPMRLSPFHSAKNCLKCDKWSILLPLGLTLLLAVKPHLPWRFHFGYSLSVQ